MAEILDRNENLSLIFDGDNTGVYDSDKRLLFELFPHTKIIGEAEYNASANGTFANAIYVRGGEGFMVYVFKHKDQSYTITRNSLHLEKMKISDSPTFEQIWKETKKAADVDALDFKNEKEVYFYFVSHPSLLYATMNPIEEATATLLGSFNTDSDDNDMTILVKSLTKEEREEHLKYGYDRISGEFIFAFNKDKKSYNIFSEHYNWKYNTLGLKNRNHWYYFIDALVECNKSISPDGNEFSYCVELMKNKNYKLYFPSMGEIITFDQFKKEIQNYDYMQTVETVKIIIFENYCRSSPASTDAHTYLKRYDQMIEKITSRIIMCKEKELPNNVSRIINQAKKYKKQTFQFNVEYLVRREDTKSLLAINRFFK